MNINRSISKILITVVLIIEAPAHANSVSFDSSNYFPIDSEFSVTVEYDFTDFLMFGGGLNLFYDTDTLRLVSYTRADLTGTDAQEMASPIGELESPGNYLGFGIGTFDFLTGMSSEGEIGTFVFEHIGNGLGTPECNYLIFCLRPDPFNPMISLAGQVVTEDIFSGGITEISIIGKFPIPGAIWLFAGGIGVLGIFRRRAPKQS